MDLIMNEARAILRTIYRLSEDSAAHDWLSQVAAKIRHGKRRSDISDALNVITAGILKTIDTSRDGWESTRRSVHTRLNLGQGLLAIACFWGYGPFDIRRSIPVQLASTVSPASSPFPLTPFR